MTVSELYDKYDGEIDIYIKDSHRKLVAFSDAEYGYDTHFMEKYGRMRIRKILRNIGFYFELLLDLE